MIKIDFEYTTIYGKFSDALHLPENHTFTEVEIEQLKEERLNNWIAIVTSSDNSSQNNTIEIAGEIYYKLEGIPPSGASLIEVENIWYYKV
jgi:hypothetical protein